MPVTAAADDDDDDDDDEGQLTKHRFQEIAGCKISDEFWNEWKSQLQRKHENDDLFSLVVRAAQKEEKAAQKEEKAAKMQEKAAQNEAKMQEELEKLQEQLNDAKMAANAESFLVLSVSAAAKDDSLRKQFRRKQVGESACRGGFIAQKFYLEFVLASREFPNCSVEEKDRKKVVQALTELGKVLSQRAKNSMFWNAHLDEEGPQSAITSELFQLAISMLQKDDSLNRLRVTHQQHVVASPALGEFKHIRKRNASGQKKRSDGNSDGKKTDDRVDVCIWFVHEDDSLGSCIAAACEYKPNNSQEDARIAQADMYGNNIFLLHKKPCVVIDIVGGNDVSNWVVSARGLVKADFSPKEVSFEKSPLYTGKGPEAIVSVVVGLLKAKPSFPKKLSDFGDRLGPNVSSIDGFVYKVYDGAKTRSPNIEIVRSITGDTTAELLKSKDEELQIMKMAQFDSDWKKPVNAKCAFGSIISKLQKLHNNYAPHGDIRLANLLSSGHIIDFDFVLLSNYPTTLNSIAKDGRRHPDVEKMIETNKNERSLLKMEECHDWFSLGKVMELFEPTEKSNNRGWKSVCCLVEEGKANDAVEQGFDYEIRLKDHKIPLRGTGNTPTKKPVTKTKKGRSTAS